MTGNPIVRRLVIVGAFIAAVFVISFVIKQWFPDLYDAIVRTEL